MILFLNKHKDHIFLIIINNNFYSNTSNNTNIKNKYFDRRFSSVKLAPKTFLPTELRLHSFFYPKMHLNKARCRILSDYSLLIATAAITCALTSNLY